MTWTWWCPISLSRWDETIIWEKSLKNHIVNTNIPPPRFNNCLYFTMFALPILGGGDLVLCFFFNWWITSFLKDLFPYLQRTSNFSGGDKPYVYERTKNNTIPRMKWESEYKQVSVLGIQRIQLVLWAVKSPRRRGGSNLWRMSWIWRVGVQG